MGKAEKRWTVEGIRMRDEEIGGQAGRGGGRLGQSKQLDWRRQWRVWPAGLWIKGGRGVGDSKRRKRDRMIKETSG